MGLQRVIHDWVTKQQKPAFGLARGKGVFYFHSSIFPDPVLPPLLQGRKPQILSIPSPWAWWSPSSSAFWRTLESQRHSPSWCPTTRFTLTAPYHRLSSRSDGTRLHMSWLLSYCVPFYTGQCPGFLPVYHQMLRYPSPWRWETRWRIPCRLGTEGALISPASAHPHTSFHFLFQLPMRHGLHVSVDLHNGSWRAPFPTSCPDPHQYWHPYQGHLGFWNSYRWIKEAFSFLFKKIILYTYFKWLMIALQNLFDICHTSTWTRHRYTYEPSLFSFPPTSHPSRLLQSPSSSPWVIQKISIDCLFCICLCKCVHATLHSFHPLLLSCPCPSVRFLCLHLHGCPANRFISAIFVDSIYMH